MDEMVAWGEEQGKEEDRLHERMNDWWDSLPKDAQEKAFFSVVSRIAKAELVDDKTYRQILHEDFGFDAGAYYMGIICGFMQLHNAIVPPNELGEMRTALREKKQREKELAERFRIKSVCDSCGYQSMDIYPDENRMCPSTWCEGGMIALDK
jgi:rubrerythrin